MTTDAVAPETLNAWAICLRASEEARRRGDRRYGTDHILLALLEEPSIEDALGVSLAQARHALDALDSSALSALGLDFSADPPPLAMREVPRKPRFRDVVQKDRLRITPAAKKVLEQAAKPNRRKLQISAHQLLDQVLALRAPDPAAVLLQALGVNTSEVRNRLNTVTPES